MNWLPARSYFDKKTEQAFQDSLNERSRSNLATLSYIGITILLSFFILSFVIETNDKLADNIGRLLIAAIMLPMLLVTLKTNTKKLDTLWLCLVGGLSILLGIFFFTYALRHNELNEGSPMLAAILFSTIPVLHLGQKLVIWSLLAISLISIQLFTNVDITWSLHFFALTVLVIGAMQYHTDILLRSQYKHELIEADKAQTDQLTGGK